MSYVVGTRRIQILRKPKPTTRVDTNQVHLLPLFTGHLIRLQEFVACKNIEIYGK